MKENGEKPMIEQSAHGLGVRSEGTHADVTPDQDGNVHPGAGMSVAPDDPMLLIQHRRPPEFGGTGKHPVWSVLDEHLGPSLAYRQDTLEHGTIDPAGVMSLAEYRAALASTVDDWTRVEAS